ncbi:MAG: amidase [Comamonadaceae bacterium]|nr:MAG: amidase [Comamonadaceae bacterium]
MSTREPWQCDAGALAAAYAGRTLSPVETLASITQRMHALQPVLNPIVCWDADGALAAARASEERWQRSAPLSPLDGVPVTVKDNIPVAGLPCRWGSRLYADHMPTRDESPVARLRAAGAVIVGKTNVPEFTLLGYTDNLLNGPTRNPWNPALTPGGSSGGAVACVAAGIAPIALATDGGGSIRRPCSHVGIAGLKPSFGRVPRADGLPDLLPGMEVIGPIARSVGDLMRMLAVIGPSSGATPLPDHAGPRRIACWTSIADGPVDPEILARTHEAIATLRALGHTVDVRAAPDVVDRFNRDAWPVISGAGLAAVLAPHAQRLGHSAVEALLTPAMRAMWETARTLTPARIAAAQQLVRELQAALLAMFETCDLLLTPAAAALPWPATETHPTRIADQEVGPRGHAVFTAFVNACGLPALAVPLAPSREGLPIGMQLVAPMGTDDALCRFGLAWEAAQPWADRWPA